MKMLLSILYFIRHFLERVDVKFAEETHKYVEMSFRSSKFNSSFMRDIFRIDCCLFIINALFSLHLPGLLTYWPNM